MRLRRLACCLALLVVTADRVRAQEPAIFAEAESVYFAKDYVRASGMFVRAVDQGSILAPYYLGVMSEFGYGTSVDNVKSTEWFVRGANRGCKPCARSAGNAYYAGRGVAKDLAAAARWFKRGTELGDTQSMVFLAYVMERGQGVPVDTPAARALTERAAGLGDADAMSNLGFVYKDGEGVPVDTARAIEWFARAGEYGSRLGAKNAYALYWYSNKWASQAYADLATRLGDTTTAKVVVTKPGAGGGLEEYSLGEKAELAGQQQEALRLFEIAAKKGHGFATARLMLAYRDGTGVPADPVKARQTSRICATMGVNDCRTILGQYLERGTAGMRDPEGARLQYERAAEGDNTLAMFLLAEMYDQGKGIDRNDGLATYWYRVAYGKGSVRATALLKSRGLLEVDPRVKAFLARIDRDGPDRTDPNVFAFEVMQYCKWGGTRCTALEYESRKFYETWNAGAERANMARIWNAYAPKAGANDAEWAARSACMQKKIESRERQNSGKQDWSFAGSC